MEVIIPVVLIMSIILVFLSKSKIDFIKARNSSEKILAEVVEYRKEKVSMRNDYTKIEYPYVKIDLESDEYILRKLRYASNAKRYFKKGEQVHVFWKGNDLLYWHTCDEGLQKYLPEKWFWET